MKFVSGLVVPMEPPADRAAQLLVLVKEAVDGWGDLESADALGVTELSGGITNKLYKIALQGEAASTHAIKTIVARVFGEETDRIISRESERFYQSIFIRTFGRAENALVYEFLDGRKPMEPEDMRAHADVNARTLAQFHKKATQAAKDDGRWDANKNGLAVYFDEWVKLASIDAKERLLASGKSAALEKYDLGRASVECDWLKDTLFANPVMAGLLDEVVCHNDLLGGNCMATVDAATGAIAASPDVKFIDFEYACKNFALFDLGNHFNEWAGIDVDWSLCPTNAEMARFISVYMAEAKGAAPGEDELARLVVLVELFQLASNAMWGLWALIQAAFSSIEFDYLDYGTQRWAQYHKLKPAVAERLRLHIK